MERTSEEDLEFAGVVDVGVGGVQMMPVLVDAQGEVGGDDGEGGEGGDLEGEAGDEDIRADVNLRRSRVSAQSASRTGWEARQPDFDSPTARRTRLFPRLPGPPG